MSFSAVAAMVRLGKKYDIPHLRDEGLARLKLQFPTRLEDFEKLSPTDYTHIKHTSGDLAFAVVELAHECKIRSILPSLYFVVARNMVRKQLSMPFRASP